MMTFYGIEQGRPVVIDSHIIGPDVVWVDLLSPTKEEEQELERQLHLEVPTGTGCTSPPTSPASRTPPIRASSRSPSSSRRSG
jgi:Mg2+ and Co2+ transporter CorA